MKMDIFDEEVSIDLAPLIDVVFMLLVFFIMTTTFSKPVIDIVLPKAEHTEEKERSEELVISLTKEGGYFYKDEQYSVEQLEHLFKENPEATINLYVDQKAPFDSFVQVVDKAKAREAGKFVISTEVAN